MKLLILAGAAAALLAAQSPDVNSIMAQVATNQAKSREQRTQWIFEQHQLLRMVRGGGRIAREEHREYLVLPDRRGVKKQLTHFDGKYQKHSAYISYDQPGYEYKGLDLDGSLIDGLSTGLTDDERSVDGIEADLFPLTYHQQLKYDFRLVGGLENYRGRKVWRVHFEPKTKASLLDADETGHAIWKGEALIDAEEYQPVAVTTSLATKLPAAVRILLGTNIRGLGFSLEYGKVADGVWFPVSYGGEFEVTGLFFYRRTMSISLADSGFRHADVSSQIAYAEDEQ